jgi:hypothetical protein
MLQNSLSAFNIAGMDFTEYLKKSGIDKLIFLLILVVIVLTAKLVVDRKMSISLSESLSLPYSGLSVSLPESTNWKHSEKWKHAKDHFVCTGVFFREKQPACIVNCKYYLYRLGNSPSERLKRKAAFNGYIIRKKGTIAKESLQVNWAHLVNKRYGSDMYFAVVALPGQRYAEVELVYAPYYRDSGERAFYAVIESLQFEPNNWLKKGTKLTTELKESNLAKLITESKPHPYYIITDQNETPVGFNINVTSIQDTENSQYPVKFETMTHLNQPFSLQQVTLFQSSYFMENFHWKSETARQKSRNSVEMKLTEPNELIIRNYTSKPSENRYILAEYNLPEVATDLLYKKMIQSDIDKVVVDILAPEGAITPFYIEKIDSENLTGNHHAGLEIEVLSGTDLQQRVSFDENGKIVQIILNYGSDKTYIFEPVSSEKLIEVFPEHSESIMQRKNSNSKNFL